MKYRIKLEGHKYYPQSKKYLFSFWRYFTENNSFKIVGFKTLKEASDSITEYIREKNITIFPYEGG